ncbi:MAG: type I polyketide synthase, partial [bacterium]|nr:type I polyketide synthase [bacterium]
VGFTAPSIDGQANAIETAHYIAQVEPESITYVETHGTGTTVGDPIEINALTKAFNTDKKAFCGIGSVKTNIGHADTAAGAAGFIKTTLALKHKLIPPSLHFERPNSKCDFVNSPFYVNARLSKWENDNYPLRAGVSSFGIGGTNAHVLLQEAPPIPGNQPSLPPGDYHLVTLSAKTSTALDKIASNLAAFLNRNRDIDLADTVYTLQLGRHHFGYRRILVCSNQNQLIDALNSLPDRQTQNTGRDRHFFSLPAGESKLVVLVFPGFNVPDINMGPQLYRQETVFRQQVQRCLEILNTLPGFDSKAILN